MQIKARSFSDFSLACLFGILGAVIGTRFDIDSSYYYIE
jgi:hypothetical protein